MNEQLTDWKISQQSLLTRTNSMFTMQGFHVSTVQFSRDPEKILVFSDGLKSDTRCHFLCSRIQSLNQRCGRGCASLGLRCHFCTIWLDLPSPWNPWDVQLNWRKQSKVWAGADHACCCIAAWHGMAWGLQNYCGGYCKFFRLTFFFACRGLLRFNYVTVTPMQKSLSHYLIIEMPLVRLAHLVIGPSLFIWSIQNHTCHRLSLIQVHALSWGMWF